MLTDGSRVVEEERDYFTFKSQETRKVLSERSRDRQTIHVCLLLV